MKTLMIVWFILVAIAVNTVIHGDPIKRKYSSSMGVRG